VSADVIALGERLFVAVIRHVAGHCAAELRTLGRSLTIPEVPFPRISYSDAAERFGEPFDDSLSQGLTTPVWVVDFPRRIREFYDREDPCRPEILLDMDLMYPEGFGEALSGGEREFEPAQIRTRLGRDGIPEERYATYLARVDEAIPRSAGFGIGIERWTRYAAGLDRIEDARLFPKIPGDVNAI
jgi:asparaginyl-tRNA synthetase